MKNAAAAAVKKRSNSNGVAEPPAKRPSRDVAASHPSGYNLTPELIGHIARFLPLGTPDMMRLLLCVGPRVAAVVRKMYLTGSEYYLDYCIDTYRRDTFKKKRMKECIGFWMDYNEKAWKKRCLGKKHRGNVHSVMLTPEQLQSLNYGSLYGLVIIYTAYSVMGEESVVLEELAKNSLYVFLISVGDKDVDDGREMTVEEYDEMVDAATGKSDGKLCVRFMCLNFALFAYPKIFLIYDLVDVLRHMIEEKVIKSGMISQSREEDIFGDDERIRQSLLYLAVVNDSANCFRYLLSLPGTDINAVAISTEMQGFQYIENIIHVCLGGRICPSYLKAILSDSHILANCFHYLLSLPSTDINAVASSTETLGFQYMYMENIIHVCVGVRICPNYLKGILADSHILLDAQDSFGRTAFFMGCNRMGDQTITKLRLLLEAGADPRIEDEAGDSPLSHIDSQIKTAQTRQDDDLEIKLKSLRKDVVARIDELNHSGG